MCGIYGFFGNDRTGIADQNLLQSMDDTIFHRGPDSHGTFVDGSFGFGMRRLSIIDLSTGDQPLCNEDGSIQVVFNGEIYNHAALRRDLEEQGHRFATDSDTEVLVHLYEERGDACVDPLRGMFAFAIWDAPRRRLLLTRDRLGIKPLYWTDTSQGLVFGSELKSLVKSPWVQRRLDRGALSHYLRYGYVPDPQSILEGVHKLPPGHLLVVEKGHAGSPRRYWDAAKAFRSEQPVATESDLAEDLWERFRDSVRSHLVSDVPLGAFLSGGLDSSAVVAAMAAETGIPVKTFSVGFREEGFNELPQARLIAKEFGTEHHEFIVEPGHLDILERLLSFVDEPFADASAIPTYLISELAQEHVKVVLSGDGGDEIFAGYDRYVVDWRRRHIGMLGNMGLGNLLRVVSNQLPEGAPGKNWLYNLSLPHMERYLDSISLFPPRVLGTFLEPSATSDPFEDSIARSIGLDPLSRLQHLDLETYLPGDILTKVDRMSMAHSLEVRVPFLDHQFVEFACALPPALRMRNGQTKYLFRRALRGRIPDEIIDGGKRGFAVPLEAWFSHRLPGFFADLLGGASMLESIGFRRTAVAHLLDLYHSTHREDHCRRLWALVVLDRSLRTLLGNSSG